MKAHRLLVGALLVAAAGCSDSNSPFGLNGSLSFSHTGATTGTFNASGSLLVLDPQAATWAAGARDDANQSIGIVANVARTSTTFDDIVIDFPQLTTGTVTVANGAAVAIAFGQTTTGTAQWICGLTSGSVTVSSISGSRVRGSFSGAGTCLASTGGPVAFTVSNGDFDVPLLDVDMMP
jgi:hypothetical protein